MARSRRHGSQSGTSNIWPGFVDALATLLLVMIFLLVIFVLAQVILSRTLTGKDAALDRLNQQVNELANLLDLERQANAELRLNITQLSSSLQSAVEERDQASIRLEGLQEKNQTTQSALAALEGKSEEQQEQVRQLLLEISSLREDLIALRKMRDELEARIGGMADKLALAELTGDDARRALALLKADAGKLKSDLATTSERARQLETDKSKLETEKRRLETDKRDLETAKVELEEKASRLDEENSSLRDRSKKLVARLADEAERTRLSQVEIKKRDIRLEEVASRYALIKQNLDDTLQLSTEQRAQVALLNQQIAALREQISILNQALEASESLDRKQETVIKDLGSRLNKALASKVAELARYRSEFFGRLREVLGRRKDVQIVGDRFVFQSEVLFLSASAKLEPAGQDQLAQLAQTLTEIARDIPSDVDWILRIDGHTDRFPIKTQEFPSNWELSTARAISVVKFLIDQGIPPKRLAATGFGAHQPLDLTDDENAHRVNRRIEMKLTQR